MICEVAKYVPHCPVMYYHIPFMSGVECDVYNMLNIASEKCPNVIGMKYTG